MDGRISKASVVAVVRLWRTKNLVFYSLYLRAISEFAISGQLTLICSHAASFASDLWTLQP